MPRKRCKPNKKKNQPKIVLPSPVLLILLTVAGVSLFYLWICGRCDALGKDITRLESDLETLRKRGLNEQYKWSNMKSPRNMERLLVKHGLDDMILPAEHNIVRAGQGWSDRVAMASQEDQAAQYASLRRSFMND